MVRLLFLLCLFTSLFACDEQAPSTDQKTADRPPNVVIIFADDQGYGDLSSYGSTTVKTPNIDRLGQEGMKLTSFYAFPSCSPSRAALLTGCYPPRVGIPNVIGPLGPAWTADKQYGLNPQETTLPEMLKTAGYATAMVGKWHLGHFPATMPLQHGFDSFFGLPYSNDMIPTDFHTYPDLALLNGTDTVAINPDQTQLTEQYTTTALDFIERHRDTSFFLYLAHSMPHVPLFTSEKFKDRSGQGIFTDVIEEVDASVGRITEQLDRLGLSKNTLVIYTSDNGPWLTYGNHAGSAGPFREGKGTTYEGGMRVPFLAYWPGKIEANTISHAPASLIDILPTVAAVSGAKMPVEKTDGRDLSALLLQQRSPEVTPFYYYRSGKVDAIRRGDWKLHVPHSFRYVNQIKFDGKRGSYAYRDTELELYNLQKDAGERYNRAAEYPEIVAELQALITAQQAEMDQEKRAPYRPGE